MSTSDYVTIISVLISFFSVLLVLLELHRGTNQRKVDSQIRLYDINRELLSMGFSHPELFQIFEGKSEVDPLMERHYLQLWLNQLALVHTFSKQGVFTKEVRESFEQDARFTLELPNMQRHWKEFGKYYPASFQTFVNDIILDEAGVETVRN